MSKRSLVRIAVIAILVIVLDQITKNIIVQWLTPGEIVPVIPGFFNLTLTYNLGAAFGLFADFAEPARTIVLVIITMVALCVVCFFLLTDYLEDPVGQSALALVLGGAGGNVIDRVFIGGVVDFLDFYVQSYHWPAFNFADSMICFGAFIVVLRRPKRTKKSS